MARLRSQKPTRSDSTSRKPTNGPNINPSHARFGQQLDRNGIVFARSRVDPPADLDELLQDLNRSRDSKSPSECEYRAYVEAVDTSYNEDTMTRAYDSIAKSQQRRRSIVKTEDGANPPSRRYVTVYNMQWTESSTSIQDGLSNPKPDVIEGLTTMAYPTDALEALGDALSPSKHPPAMPAFVVHAKGPHGQMDEAEKQCAYDGAVMVHSAQRVRQYLARPSATFDSHTQALTVAFNGADLHIYANHRTSDDKYHCYPLTADKPCFSFARYKAARRQLRNAQDWAYRRTTRTCDHLWEKSRRDAAILERRRLQRAREDEEDAKCIAGMLTPPPSSTHARKQRKARSNRSQGVEEEDANISQDRRRLSLSPCVILPSVEADENFETPPHSVPSSQLGM